jgi:hypothetical protein
VASTLAIGAFATGTDAFIVAALLPEIAGSDVDAAAEDARDGLARLSWASCGSEGERRLNAAGVSVRCVTTAEGSVPGSPDEDDLVAIAGRAY